MKKIYLRWVSLLLALLMLLLTACGGTETPNTPSDDPTDPTDPTGGASGDPSDEPKEPSTGDFVLSDTTAYKVIVSEFASKQEESAARLIRNELEKLYGTKPGLSSDWVTGAPTDEEVASWKEILVGDVDRAERKEATANMGGDNYIIRVSGNKLIVLGATDEMTVAAAEYFVAELLKQEFLAADFAYSENYDPVLVETVYEPDDAVVANIIATEYPYNADPTGKTDSTGTIQSALDTLHAQGGGTVFLPVGTYLVTSTITIPSGCLLKGDWQDPEDTDSPAYGTVILAKPSALDEAYLADRTRDPLISLTQNCALDGLTFYYPDQDAGKVVKYGYTLYSQAPSCVTISNVTLLNSYRGIGIDVHADDSHELVQVEGVRMTALEIGFEEYHSTEVGNLVDIRVSPDYWAEAGAPYACNNVDALRAHCRKNTVALQFNGLDDTHLSELYVKGARTAIYLPTGRSTHDYWGVIYDVTIEECDFGIVAESLNGYGGAAIAKAVIDASEVAVYNTAVTGALKLCDVTTVGKGGIVSVGTARTYVSDEFDTMDYTIRHATYQKPVQQLYVAPILNMSRTRKDATALLQETLDKAAATGGIVYVPAGIYSVYGTLRVPAGVELRGAAPFFMRDAQSASQGVDGTVLISYAKTATVELAAGAGVNGLRIFGGMYSPVQARDLLAAGDAVATEQAAIRGLGAGVYAHNVTLTATINGIDFSDCDNFSVKQAFGAVYGDFVIGGGKGGTVEQCLTNQHFLNRQHFLTSGLMDSAYYSGWTMDSEMTATLRDEVRRVYGDMVYLIDAEDVCVSNIFTYGPRCLVLCENSSATLINTSSDFHGMGPMFDIKENSDVIALNALRSANESMACDESSAFKLVNRIAISRYNEHDFDSAAGNADDPGYTNIREKVMINDGTGAAGSVKPYTGAMAKTGNTSLYHAADTSTNASVTLYSQTVSGVKAEKYLNDNGYLHMWVYVEDMTSSIWSNWITVTSAGGTARWSTICYVTHNGWNEVWVPLSGGSGKLGGSITGISVGDQRSAKLEHSDYYFDDVYFCLADSSNPTVIKNVQDMGIDAASPVKAPALPEESREMLLSGDSLSGNRARTTPVRVITDASLVKQGAGAWQPEGTSALSQVSVLLETKNIKNYMKHGYLHLWLYVEEASAISGGAIELTSSGKSDENEISWHVKNHIKQNGWNELLLPLNLPDSTAGSFAPAGLNYLRIYLNTYRRTTVLIDDVRVYLPADAPAIDAPDTDIPDKQTYVFKVNSEAEADALAGNSQFNATTVVRFADNGRQFTYSYHVGDFSKIHGIKWSAPISGQLLLEVSTDEVNWTEVYRYETPKVDDQGLTRELRTYNLTDVVTQRDAKSGTIYIRVADAYPENGFGGAIAATENVEMVIYYTPVDASELEGASGSAGGEGDVEVPDVLPATETHIFLPDGLSGESKYLYYNDRSSVLYNKRFADGDRSFTYAYTIYDFGKVSAMSWTATTSQQLHIQFSTDGKTWVDVYKYTAGEARGLSAEQRSYDLVSLIGSASGTGKVYIKVGDSVKTDGYGGAVDGDKPVTFKVSYTGGQGDVVKDTTTEDVGSDSSFDPDNIPTASTPAPEGEVDKKLVVHDCETTDGAVMQWVPVSLNTDARFVKEGKTSWKREGLSNEYVALNFGPMDISSYMSGGYLHIWLLVTDYNLAANGQIELCSGGSADKNELRWNVADYVKGAGWNELWLPLDGATLNREDQPFDATGANYIRIWCGTTDGTYRTMYIDDIYFCTVK